MLPDVTLLLIERGARELADLVDHADGNTVVDSVKYMLP